MARKKTTPPEGEQAPEKTLSELAFEGEVGQWRAGENFTTLTVPTGWIVFHGSTSTFVPFAEPDPEEVQP